MGVPRPENKPSYTSIAELEMKLIELERNERTRSIDLKLIMQELQGFQVAMLTKLGTFEKQVEDGLKGLTTKCSKLEQVVAKYK